MRSDAVDIAQGFAVDADYLAGASVALLGKRGAGKRLALDTPLPTPQGWTTMGAAAVGDTLFDDRGLPCRVTEVHPATWGDARRVTFSDGSTLLADADHLWMTRDHHGRRDGTDPVVRTTDDIKRTLVWDGAANHSIDNAAALDTPPTHLPIHPYMLGVWLGHGTRRTPAVTTADPLILSQHVKELGYDFTERPNRRTDGSRTYAIAGLGPDLQALGVLAEKAIPRLYLRASSDQRLELLRGLMDTEGHWNRSDVEISVSDTHLADAIYELVVSLGMCPHRTVHRKQARRAVHRVTFRPTHQVFKLASKADKYCPPTNNEPFRRYVTSVEAVPSVPMRCISVDSPHRLFLAGPQMVPTHNTYTSRVLAESLFDAHVQTVIIDPMGVFWGLRASSDGEQDGLPIPVFGGDHGDAPLEASAGSLMADLVVDDGLSMVLDLSGFGSRTQERTFAAAFLDRLYRTNKDLVHLIVDEADLFAPQKPRREDTHLLVTMENIVRRGRNRGIGSTVASQRAAVVHKDVLTQVDVLVALRVTAPQDRDAIRDWVRGQGDEETWSRIAPSLPGLANGECWWWIPEKDVLRQVQVRPARTFDSSPTRTRGHSRRVPKTFADVDLAAIADRIDASIERAKATDPRELTKRIQELERALATDGHRVPRRHSEIVEVPVLDEALVERLEIALRALGQASAATVAATTDLEARVRRAAEESNECMRQASVAVADVAAALAAARTSTARVDGPSVAPGGADGVGPAPVAESTASGARADVPDVAPARKRLLAVLASLEGVGVSQARRTQLGLWAGVSPKSSGFANNLSGLHTAGLISYPAPGYVALTVEGRRLAGPIEQPVSSGDLHQKVRELITPARWRIVEKLIETYPAAVAKDQLAASVGVSAISSGYANNLSALRTLGLVDYPSPGFVAATDVLFV